MWGIIHQHDQFSETELPFLYQALADTEAKLRENNRKSSSKHKSKGGQPAKEGNVNIVSLVFIKQDGYKTKSGDRYINTKIGKDICEVQTFTKESTRFLTI